MEHLPLNEMSLETRIHQMRKLNYRHVRSGWRFQDTKLTNLKVVEHIAAEVIELGSAVGISQTFVTKDSFETTAEVCRQQVTEEIADTLNTLYHLMGRFGITEDEVLNEAHRKLDLRFEP